jgi:hypothetical protein
VLITESEIISELTKTNQGPREDPHRSGSTTPFRYTTLQYDVQTKAEEGKPGGNDIVGVTKKDVRPNQ